MFNKIINKIIASTDYANNMHAQLVNVGKELIEARNYILKLETQLNYGKELSVDETSEFDKTKPSILFNAIPKSASTYCYLTLMQGLELQDNMVTTAYFPKDMIVWKRLQRFASGGQIAHHHIDASPANVYFLNQLENIKTIIHVRDPRQVIVSWAHHIVQSGERYTPIYTVAAFPEKWFFYSWEQQLDWMIDHQLPHFVNWIIEWVEAEDRDDINVLFTTFEDFMKDREAFFEDILEFCCIDQSCFYDPNLNPNEKAEFQFRKGDTQEWRSIFSSSQCDRINKLIPNVLYKKFGWKK